MNDCLICKQPITEPLAIRCNHKFHDDCLKCEFCGHVVSVEVVLKCLHEDISPSHAPCRDKWLRDQFDKKPVTITQKHLNHLNHAISMFRPNMELSIETNKVLAANASRSFFHEFGLDEKLYALRMLEEIAAELHTAIAKDPRNLQIMLNARDLERIESAKVLRVSQADKKLAKVVKQRIKLDPETSRREKAISALISVGLDRETAILQIEKEQLKALAKKNQTNGEGI